MLFLGSGLGGGFEGLGWGWVCEVGLVAFFDGEMEVIAGVLSYKLRVILLLGNQTRWDSIGMLYF